MVIAPGAVRSASTPAAQPPSGDDAGDGFAALLARAAGAVPAGSDAGHERSAEPAMAEPMPLTWAAVIVPEAARAPLEDADADGPAVLRFASGPSSAAFMLEAGDDGAAEWPHKFVPMPLLPAGVEDGAARGEALAAMTAAALVRHAVDLPAPPPSATATATVPGAEPDAMARALADAIVESSGERRWTVTLRLDPPELGRVEVRLAREEGALSAQFVASTPAARHCLEQALPQLATQLAQQGLQLGQASVGDSSSGADAGADGGDDAVVRAPARDSDESAPPLKPGTDAVRRHTGLLDAWA